jgi:arsenate reductase
MTDVTIFHNPACGTSRNALAAIRAAGHAPKVVEYLKTGWTVAQLKDLLAAMHARPRDILRVRGTPAEKLGLTDPAATDEAILAAMITNPILVERPIVVTPKATVLARPVEKLNGLI